MMMTMVVTMIKTFACPSNAQRSPITFFLTILPPPCPAAFAARQRRGAGVGAVPRPAGRAAAFSNESRQARES